MMHHVRQVALLRVPYDTVPLQKLGSELDRSSVVVAGTISRNISDLRISVRTE
jgi:hypothetical protein